MSHHRPARHPLRSGLAAAAAIVAGVLAWLGGAVPARAQILEKEPPAAIRGMEIVERSGEKIPLDLPFSDSTGKPVKLGDYFHQGNKPVFLVMVYFRCPMQCPTILRKVRQRINEVDLTVGTQYNVVVVSFDPTEGPEAAAKQKILALTGYDRDHPPELAASWEFLTSQTPGVARKLAEALGFPYRFLPESNEYSHGTVTFVLTPDGRISRYLYGVDYPASRLRLALLEASGGKIGSTLDRVLLFCFHYDPTAGAYTLAATRIMSIGGAVTMVLLGGLLAWLWQRERARARRRLAAAVGMAGSTGANGASPGQVHALAGDRRGSARAGFGGGASAGMGGGGFSTGAVA